jgi:hypothetical protein
MDDMSAGWNAQQLEVTAAVCRGREAQRVDPHLERTQHPT